MIHCFFLFFPRSFSVPRANVTLSITQHPNMVASYITTGNNRHEMTVLNKAASALDAGCWLLDAPARLRLSSSHCQ